MQLSLSVAALVTGVVGSIAYRRNLFTTRLDLLEARIRGRGIYLLPQAELPPEVKALAQRLGARAGAASSAAFTQSGLMWRSPGAKPTRFTAHQSVATATPGFVWRASLGRAGAVLVADYFLDGIGGLEVTVLGAIPLARMLGTPGINQGEMLRYLAEIPWNPDAILNNAQLDWTVVDRRTIKVAAGSTENRAEITFTLNGDGLIETMSAPSRLYSNNGRTIALPWQGRFWNYQNISGRLLPMEGEVGWVMDGGAFVYWQGRLLSWNEGR